MDSAARELTQPRACTGSNCDPSPEMGTVKGDTHPQRVHPKEGCAPRFRSDSRWALALIFAIVGTLAQLAGCHVTRQFPSAQAAPTMQPASCSNWDESA